MVKKKDRAGGEFFRENSNATARSHFSTSTAKIIAFKARKVQCTPIYILSFIHTVQHNYYDNTKYVH